MKQREEELCALTIIKRLWKAINNSQTLNEAKEKFKETVLELILDEK